jgi:hypothetical protein
VLIAATEVHMSLNRVDNWPFKAAAIVMAVSLIAPAAAMTRRPSAHGRYLSCTVEIQTLAGAGGFIPRLELFNSGPAIPSGTIVRYRLSEGRPDRGGKLTLVNDLPANSVTRVVVYSALGFRRCVAAVNERLR